MNKAEIKADLKARGQFDINAGRDPAWIEAFRLYLQETRMKLCTSCSGSFTRLRNWMNS